VVGTQAKPATATVPPQVRHLIGFFPASRKGWRKEETVLEQECFFRPQKLQS
jgi:hypothetical protein